MESTAVAFRTDRLSRKTRIMATPERTGITKASKWAKLKTPERAHAAALAPKVKPNFQATEVILEYTTNPATNERTTNMRLGIKPRAGLSVPKPVMDEALGATKLGQSLTYFAAPITTHTRPECCLPIASFACMWSQVVWRHNVVQGDHGQASE